MIYNDAMRLRFHFSMKRLLVSMSLLCLSLGIVSWAIAGMFPAPFLAFYFATIVLGVAGSNLASRPLLGAVVVMVCWTFVMVIRTAFNAPPGVLFAVAGVLAAFLAGMRTQRYLDRRRGRNGGQRAATHQPEASARQSRPFPR